MQHEAQPSTIYALASGHGKAGIAVVRISGPHACAVVTFLSDGKLPKPREATIIKLAQHGARLDSALALYFPAPHSFTGEDVLELHTHGSHAVLKLLFEALNKIPGFRHAEPGEFSRRAFLNNKFDLMEAEGLADLIDAETVAQHKQAMRQLSGETSGQVHALREKILEPLALLEAYIDFPDEEIPPLVLTETAEKVAAVRGLILQMLDDGGIGEKIREGVEIVIFGPPNVGKSSLINILSKREVAIVSDEPGTTRDMIEVQLELGGYGVTLVDTAGLREAQGKIEAEGVRRAEARTRESDFKICMLEANAAREQYAEVAALIDDNTLIIINKTDITTAPSLPAPTHGISVKTGQGIDSLVELMVLNVRSHMEKTVSPLITRARHRSALANTSQSLARFSIDQPLELACEELRQAASEIGKITGKIMVDDILDLVFSRFCIGK